MPQQVVAGAVMMCSFGVAPSSLVVPPTNKVNAGGPAAANIMDHKPNANIPPFGMCMSLANPSVASATSAALGVLTPMPCVPVTTAPWAPGSATVMVGQMPALNSTSKCMCNWGGVIQVTYAGQVTTNIP